MTVHVPDRFKAANAFWIGLAKIGLTPAAVLSQARLPLTVYDGKKNLVTTAQFFALWRAVGEVVPRKRVTLTGIAVHRGVGFVSERPLDRRLCGLGDELVFLGQEHQQGRMKSFDLAKILLGVTSVIRDRGVYAVAHCRQVDHQCTEAVAKDRNLAGAFAQLGHSIDGVLYVCRACGSVEGLIEAQSVLPVRL